MVSLWCWSGWNDIIFIGIRARFSMCARVGIWRRWSGCVWRVRFGMSKWCGMWLRVDIYMFLSGCEWRIVYGCIWRATSSRVSVISIVLSFCIRKGGFCMIGCVKKLWWVGIWICLSGYECKVVFGICGCLCKWCDMVILRCWSGRINRGVSSTRACASSRRTAVMLSCLSIFVLKKCFGMNKCVCMLCLVVIWVCCSGCVCVVVYGICIRASIARGREICIFWSGRVSTGVCGIYVCVCLLL